jgi:hypothetical protein
MNLNDITLVTVNCNNPELGLAALRHSCEYLQFGCVKLISNFCPILPKGIVFEQIDGLPTLHAYNYFCITELHKHIETPLSLTVQTDGFVVNPELWDDVFCDFDYIGAAWPETVRGMRPGQPVGNSGFCLRSKRLLAETSRIASNVPVPRRCKDDLFACASYYPELVEAGMLFAPVEIACRFSFEMPVKGLSITEADTFGFHGKRTPGTRALCATLLQSTLARQQS